MTVTPRKFSQQSAASRSPAYTRLEQAVMAALVHDLRAQIPDLAGQIEDSRPSQRRNTGFGLFTETIVDRKRPVPPSGPTGDFGTVHAMVAHLPDPIAFKVRVRNGVLLGLYGDSYGQDTRAIDFATAHFDQVFTIDANGRSIPFETAELMPRSPLRDLQRHTDVEPAPTAPALRNVGPLQKLRDPAPARVARETPADTSQEALLGMLFGKPRSTTTPAGPAADPPADDAAVLKVGVWVSLFAIAAVLILVFELPLVLVGFLAIFAGRYLQTPAGLALVRRGVAEWKKAQSKSS